ncbi:polymorphic toxin-type HINT domain-containing protein, partial [Leptospira neocaledonica]|uniref:polymorphic toxin-type HINT domain-containing protein n=1 Tax=Leptospira neocaledonica TaxID=2023192 RepID=UPI001FCA9486
LSTDTDQKPSIFMGFGCDMGENNCGGGAANKLGLGGSLTINADGTVDLGADILGNQALGISFDSNSNSWGPVTANTNFGNDYTIMTAQNLADKAKKEAQMKVAGTYGDVLKDPNLIANSDSLKAIADSYGVKPENLPEVIQNLSDTVRNPDADPNLRQSALASLNEMMGAVHNEAYVNGNKGLKDAIKNSPAVAAVDTQGKDQHGSADDGFISQIGDQAKIYLNQIAGNAFGDFAYINDKGEVVFRSCFVAGTLVWTKDGQRPIETIQVGDIVLSWDEETSQNEYRTVTETFVNPTTTILKITYTDGTSIETTWNHPFYLQQGLWVNAKDLMQGDLSVTAEGKTATIASVVEIIRNDTVYNFEVEENHTYFVSKAGVLVHNYQKEGSERYQRIISIIENVTLAGSDKDKIMTMISDGSIGQGVIDAADKLILKNKLGKLGTALGVLDNLASAGMAGITLGEAMTSASMAQTLYTDMTEQLKADGVIERDARLDSRNKALAEVNRLTNQLQYARTEAEARSIMADIRNSKMTAQYHQSLADAAGNRVEYINKLSTAVQNYDFESFEKGMKVYINEVYNNPDCVGAACDRGQGRAIDAELRAIKNFHTVLTANRLANTGLNLFGAIPGNKMSYINNFMVKTVNGYYTSNVINDNWDVTAAYRLYKNLRNIRINQSPYSDLYE